MINFFENRRKRKFKNRLKYGQEEKPVYTAEEMTKALEVGDEDKAIEILTALVKQHKAKYLKDK
jgi:hypothetical protein